MTRESIEKMMCRATYVGSFRGNFDIGTWASAGVFADAILAIQCSAGTETKTYEKMKERCNVENKLHCHQVLEAVAYAVFKDPLRTLAADGASCEANKAVDGKAEALVPIFPGQRVYKIGKQPDGGDFVPLVYDPVTDITSEVPLMSMDVLPMKYRDGPGYIDWFDFKVSLKEVSDEPLQIFKRDSNNNLVTPSMFKRVAINNEAERATFVKLFRLPLGERTIRTIYRHVENLLYAQPSRLQVPRQVTEGLGELVPRPNDPDYMEDLFGGFATTLIQSNRIRVGDIRVLTQTEIALWNQSHNIPRAAISDVPPIEWLSHSHRHNGVLPTTIALPGRSCLTKSNGLITVGLDGRPVGRPRTPKQKGRKTKATKRQVQFSIPQEKNAKRPATTIDSIIESIESTSLSATKSATKPGSQRTQPVFWRFDVPEFIKVTFQEAVASELPAFHSINGYGLEIFAKATPFIVGVPVTLAHWKKYLCAEVPDDAQVEGSSRIVAKEKDWWFVDDTDENFTIDFGMGKYQQHYLSLASLFGGQRFKFGNRAVVAFEKKLSAIEFALMSAIVFAVEPEVGLRANIARDAFKSCRRNASFVQLYRQGGSIPWCITLVRNLNDTCAAEATVYAAWRYGANNKSVKWLKWSANTTQPPTDSTTLGLGSSPKFNCSSPQFI